MRQKGTVNELGRICKEAIVKHIINCCTYTVFSEIWQDDANQLGRNMTAIMEYFINCHGYLALNEI
jgi:hypothetical protein